MRTFQLRHTLALLSFVLTLGLSAQTSSQEKGPSQPSADTVTVVLPGTAVPSGLKAKEEWKRTTDSPIPASTSKAKPPDSASPRSIGVTEPPDPKNPPTAAVPASIPVPAMSGIVAPAAPAERQVKYEVSSSIPTDRITGLCQHVICHASLTYRNASGGTDQITVSLPWQLTFTGQVKQFVYLSAQNLERETAVECTIYFDGVPEKKSITTTPLGIATVSGTIPPAQVP
jgi:hypothetical protein